MAGSIDDDEGEISEINMTPFVDVVLVLLVIFMVTAGIMVKQGITIELPKAATAENLKTQKTLNILVGPEGQILLDGKPLENVNALKQMVREFKQNTKKVVAMISADEGVLYNSVVGVMDSLREEGVYDFALQLEKLSMGETKGN